MQFSLSDKNIYFPYFSKLNPKTKNIKNNFNLKINSNDFILI